MSFEDRYRALTKSQFPVFTIYAQKSCLGVKPCERAWCFDRVLQHRLQGHVKREAVASSRQDCLEMCLGERDFICSIRLDVGSHLLGICSLESILIANKPYGTELVEGQRMIRRNAAIIHGGA
uniref:Apple domain-containing protein n=1 Tax=Timema cristinae TaxID=61476 RepID=A0A7R9C990_TIMCR|nr:unnamed protein product [Timema cristinae]